MKHKKLATLVLAAAIGFLFVDVATAAPAKVVVEDRGDFLLFYSPGVQNGRSIVYCHAGFAPTNKSYAECKFLARLGYDVAAVKYSSAKSLADDLLIVKRARDEIAGGRTFIFGVSRGGFLALQAFMTDNDGYDGAVIVAGPTSVGQWHTSMSLPLETRKYFASGMDAVADSDLIKKPMFLLYGTEDTVVPASQGKMLWEKNPELFEFETLPADHGIMSNSRAIRMIADWLEWTALKADEETE